MSDRVKYKYMDKVSFSTANLGFEKELWAAADKLRGSVDPSEYKYIVLGLIFLKYISDSFEELYNKLKNDPEGLADPEDPDEYIAEKVFWVPKEARWEYLRKNAKKPGIGKLIDDAMVAIEKDNPSLKGVLPKEYARLRISERILGELIDLFSSLDLRANRNSKTKQDVLGRVYEYFIGKFAAAEGKGGGEFFTPPSVVKLLVEMIQPFKGRVYDPCCGSGGMFIQSEKFVEAHGGRIDDIAIYGQESNPTTWQLCKMNLVIRRISAKIALGDSFHNDQFKDLKADFILANPPFNQKEWGGERLRDDPRWQYGIPPVRNANYAWIQHFIYHLSPSGIAGFVMANGALSSNTSGEGEIRKNIIKAGLIDCIVALPDKLFYTTQIPASLWFISRNRYNHKFRDRRNEILFIDARKMGQMIDRRHRELTDKEIQKIASTYHNWRSKNGKYQDIKGFCKSTTLEEVAENDYVLTPGRYVGIDFQLEDDEVFEEKMHRLIQELAKQFEESKELEKKIRENLRKIGYEL